MKSKATTGARLLLGLIFFVFGLNGFLQFLPMPPMPEPAQAFMGALASTGYFFPVLKTTEIVCGALLLLGRFVPLALTVLAPITVNIVLFHLFLAPGGLILPLVIVALGVFLAIQYGRTFQPVLQAKPQK